MSQDFLKQAQEAFDASTSFFESNHRDELAYSLRAFRSEHATNSKYSSPEFQSRSRLFRPKTRSIIRKNEAAAMQAAFSNREMVFTEPVDPDNAQSVDAANALKEVIEYRLEKTIPTFEIYLGGVQDAQTTGAVCSYQYWEYQKNKTGKKLKDKPCIELRPIENLRFDSGASWVDPVNTSPYWCDIIPMLVCEVRAMMSGENDKNGGKWKKYDDKTILKAKPEELDLIRQSRLGKGQDPHQESTGIKDYDIVWVMRWIMRDSQNEDQVFYTLGTEELLTDAKPIEEVYFHGHRPYALGYAVLETHKVWKTPMPILMKPIQQEINDVANQRLDNVKYVLNKRMYVARGRQVDVGAITRNAPGGVVMMTDPKNDVIESNHPDVTSSAYVEQDRLNAELDDLAGNFSPSTKVANNAVNDTLGGSKLAAAGAGLMSEYLIRTVNETWWSKVMVQLGLLERYYESDDVILSICAKKSGLFPRIGPQQLSQILLDNEVNVRVDMAMGDPNQRLQKFLLATNSAIQLIGQAPPGANVQEMIKEIYSNAGYREGARFFGAADPRLQKMAQMIQQLHGQLNGKQMEIQADTAIKKYGIDSVERTKNAEIRVNAARIDGELKQKSMDTAVEHAKNQQGDGGQLALDHHHAVMDSQDARWKALLDAHTKIIVAEITKSGVLQKAQIDAANTVEG